MIKAYQLYTGPDGHSHVIQGSMVDNQVIGAESILYEESAPHASLDWHNAPTTQYVITLSGILEFVTHGGEKFTINPGEILVALDTTGSGHKWRLTNDQPWKRAYVVFKEGTKINFRADDAQSKSGGA
jgi:quercetin dioxygenase-like cupin family protein